MRRASTLLSVLLLTSVLTSGSSCLSSYPGPGVGTSPGQTTYTTRHQLEGIVLPYTQTPLVKTAVTVQQGKRALARAFTYLGVPYVWGGESAKGIDCSGLVLQAYRSVIPGMLLQSWDSPAAPDAAAIDLYYYDTIPIEPGDLRAGDLVFMAGGSSGLKVTHVIMVKSVSGSDITFINATTRYWKVMEETWSMSGAAWKKAYVGCGRLLYISPEAILQAAGQGKYL